MCRASLGLWLLGVLGTANAVGAIVASLVIGQMSHLRRRGLIAYVSLMISCVATIVYGLPLPHALEPGIASAASVCAGFGVGVFGVIWVTVVAGDGALGQAGAREQH